MLNNLICITEKGNHRSLSGLFLLSVFFTALLAGCGGASLYQDRIRPAKLPDLPDEHIRLQAVTGKKHMIAAANPLATQAGFEMLEAGGSTVDAAIATQMVLTLVEPQSSGIGGGAFVLHFDAKTGDIAAWDGRETAPAGAKPDMFLKANGKPVAFKDAAIGGRAVAVPGLLRLLEDMHRKHGKLPWAKLFQPAINLAEDGFIVTPRLAKMIGRTKNLDQMAATRAYFFHADGSPLKAGDRLVNKPYANSLRLIAQWGTKAFYGGPLAEQIVEAVQTSPINPGNLTLDDLADYKAKQREAVCLFYRVSLVCGMPPPSSGGIASLQILGILQNFDLPGMPPAGTESLHLIAEASRLAYADRKVYIADSDFFPVPTEGLLNPDYLKRRSQQISPDKSLGHADPGMPGVRTGRLSPGDDHPEATSTTHLSIVDDDGNALSMTSSIETIFGSKVMAGGFLLNNHMTDFSFVPERDGGPVANAIEPGKRPRSSMAPTIVFNQDGNVRLVIGSPGGSRIIGFVVKALVAHLDWGLDVQQAISLGNINNRNGATELEKGTSLAFQKSALEALGHKVTVKPITSGLHGLSVSRDGLKGGADPRREGLVMGR